MRKFALIKLSVVFGVLLGAWLYCTNMPALAQSDNAIWTPPLNVSASGAASEPVVAAIPDGTMYVLWWDTAAGEQYARVSLTQTERIAPVTLPDIVGERVTGQDPRTLQQVTLIQPPREIRALTDATGRVHVLWTNARGQLLSIQITGTRVTPATILSESTLLFDIAADSRGGVRVAYLRPTDEQRSPAGLYYRAWTEQGWSSSTMILSSRYFITAKRDRVAVSVAGNGEGTEVVAWDDPQAGRSLYARSSDGGKTWTTPQTVGFATSSSVTQARVAYAPNTEFVLIWRDLNAGSCALTQLRSNDGMQTWSAPERVLNDLTSCPEHWTFTWGADGRMWLLGMPDVLASGTSGGAITNNRAVLASWNGQKWSSPVALGLSFFNTAISQTVNLGCLNVALSWQTVGVVGCDSRGDVWVARNDASLDNLIPALTPIWDRVDVLSQVNQDAGAQAPLGGVGEVPALSTDAQGQLYAMWSQSVQMDKPRTNLIAAVWNGQSWSRAAQVLESPVSVEGSISTTNGLENMAVQPSLVADTTGKLHAVWVGGAGGILFYSWASARDAVSAQGWSQPVSLPAPTRVCSWPSIVADPRTGALYVIYAVPYNELRGIYMLRSDDHGVTWSAPRQIFDAVAAGWLSADKPQLAFDATSNKLHAIWIRTNPFGGSTTQAIYYARSADDGQTWTIPALLAEGMVDWPRIGLLATNQIVTIWNEQRSVNRSQAATPMTVWERFSPDGGDRWTDPVHVPGFDHVSGPVAIASEQNGVLFLTGLGQTTTGESSLLFAQRQGQGWDQHDTFGLGQDAVLGNAVAASLAPGVQRLNVVMRNWQTGRSGVGQFMTVAMMREISATIPGAAPAPTFTPLPESVQAIAATPTSAPASTVVATQTSAPTTTPKPEIPAQSVSQPSGTGSLQPESVLVVSGVLTMVIVVAAIFIRSLYHARH